MPFFTGQEIIGDILSQLPEAAEILSSHGIACASCNVSQYEKLQDGIIGHGHGEDTFRRILVDLNEAAEDTGLVKTTLPEPILTPVAADKVRAFQNLQNKPDTGFKIEVIEPDSPEPAYHLDLVLRPSQGDLVVETEDLKLFLDPDSYRFLRGKQIDFVEAGEDTGFRVLEIETKTS